MNTTPSRALRTLYLNLPDFNNNHIAVYDVLLHYLKCGYAWPSMGDIQMEAGVGETTATSAIKTLRKYELIKSFLPNGKSRTYSVKVPIDDPDVFYAKYPEALAEREKRSQIIRERSSRTSHRQRNRCSCGTQEGGAFREKRL
ncbi:hypothetical protein SAMN05518848_101737 [Paenibacillus sp. PDC88]|nr:hypothetical protein SAMN05518848_101737 [Paenibacillus sp. PDC88]